MKDRSQFSGYETHVNDHLLEIRDVRQRPAATVRASMAGAWTHPTLITGIDSGPVRVEINHFQTAPEFEIGDWEEAAEVSIQIEPGGVVVVGIEDDSSGMPPIGAAEGGGYRLRIYALGRSLAYDAYVPAAVETYRIEAWSAPWSAPAVLAKNHSAALPDLVLFPDSTGVQVLLFDGGLSGRLLEQDAELRQRELDNIEKMSRRRRAAP